MVTGTGWKMQKSERIDETSVFSAPQPDFNPVHKSGQKIQANDRPLQADSLRFSGVFLT